MSEELCEVPPNGWKCSRERGHEGPCAATPAFMAAPDRRPHNPHKNGYAAGWNDCLAACNTRSDWDQELCREAFEAFVKSEWAQQRLPMGITDLTKHGDEYLKPMSRFAFEVYQAAWNTRANAGDWDAVRKSISFLAKRSIEDTTGTLGWVIQATLELTAALPENQKS